MATQKIVLYNADTDTAVELEASVEDARRAQQDIQFASALLNAAVQEDPHVVDDNTTLPSTSAGLQDTSPSTSAAAICINEEQSVEQQSVEQQSVEQQSVEQGGASGEESLYRWATPCVLLLLETYKQKEKKLTSGKQPQKKVWEEIAAILQQHSYNVTGPQCASKLRSLKKTYKAIKDHNSTSGNDRRTWQFFETMDDLFAKKAWVEPVATASSTGVLTTREAATPHSSGSSHVATKSAATSMSIASLLKRRIEQKEEHEAKKAKRHEEQMAIDKQLLAVLQKLVEK